VVAGGGLVFAAYPSLAVALGPGTAVTLWPGTILALDAATGEERWRQATGGSVVAPPAWNNGWLLAGTTDGRLTMLRADRGRPLWRRESGAALRPGAEMAGDRLYVLLDDGRVAALTLERGDLLWERKLPGRGTTLTALDDRVFVGADDRYFYCLAAEDGDVNWRWRAGGAILGTPVVDEDSIYFLSLDNVLRSLNRGNGHQRWKRGLSFRPIGGPVAAGDILLVPGLAPEIPAFAMKTGAPAGKVALHGELTAPPLILAAGGPGSFSLVAVTGETVQRLGPAPPLLESHPVPGLPLYLPLAPSALAK
jgi:outer membrane protein assembly factor BamB